MSRLDKLKAKINFEKLVGLERDIILFYDYLRFSKEELKTDDYLTYCGTYSLAFKIMKKRNIIAEHLPKFFNNSNYIQGYAKIRDKFELVEFKDEQYLLEDVSLKDNKWRIFDT